MPRAATGDLSSGDVFDEASGPGADLVEAGHQRGDPQRAVRGKVGQSEGDFGGRRQRDCMPREGFPRTRGDRPERPATPGPASGFPRTPRDRPGAAWRGRAGLGVSRPGGAGQGLAWPGSARRSLGLGQVKELPTFARGRKVSVRGSGPGGQSAAEPRSSNTGPLRAIGVRRGVASRPGRYPLHSETRAGPHPAARSIA